MYNYIKRSSDYKLYISKGNEMIVKDMPFQTFFNKLLIKELTNLSSREKSIKKALRFKSKVPIYINRETMFMCLKSYRLNNSFYINYFSITSHIYKNNFVIVNFQNKHSMKLVEKNIFQNQMEKCLMILDYLN